MNFVAWITWIGVSYDSFSLVYQEVVEESKKKKWNLREIENKTHIEKHKPNQIH